MTIQKTSWFARPAVVALLLCTVGFVTFSLLWRIVRILSQDPPTNIYRERTEKLENEVNELKVELDNQNDPFYQETIIRDQLNLQKPDEVILQLPNASIPPKNN